MYINQNFVTSLFISRAPFKASLILVKMCQVLDHEGSCDTVPLKRRTKTGSVDTCGKDGPICTLLLKYK
jgi:hypothetical protein